MERKQPKCVEIGPGPCLACADAQATIAALQARVRELEQWVQDQSTANLEKMRHTDEMQSRAMEAESQLAQRTAQLTQLDRTLADVYAQRDGLQKDLAQRTAELEAAQRKVDLAEKKAWLAAHDVGFFSMWNGTDHSGPPKLALLCNDTFAWATADAEDVLDAQIDTIVELFKSEGEAGVIKWIAQQRNMKPMESVGKWLFGCDAIKKERDDLQAELERVRGEIAETKEVEVALSSKVAEYEIELNGDPQNFYGRGRTVGLRTLIAALPKVEGEIEVSSGVYNFILLKRDTVVKFLCGQIETEQTAQAIAALWEHRQGMEG